MFRAFSKMPVLLFSFGRRRKDRHPHLVSGNIPNSFEIKATFRKTACTSSPASGRPFRKCIFCVFKRIVQFTFLLSALLFFVCFCFSCKVAACFDPYVLQLVTDFVISLHSFLFSHFLFSPFKHGLLILHEIWSVGGHN